MKKIQIDKDLLREITNTTGRYYIKYGHPFGAEDSQEDRNSWLLERFKEEVNESEEETQMYKAGVDEMTQTRSLEIPDKEECNYHEDDQCCDGCSKPKQKIEKIDFSKRGMIPFSEWETLNKINQIIKHLNKE